MTIAQPEYAELADGALARILAAEKIALDEYRSNLERERKAEERRIARRTPVEQPFIDDGA